MPVVLKQAIDPDPLTTAKVVAFKVENNVSHWVEIWIGFGKLVGGVFVESPTIPPKYVRIENGCHPLSPNTSLRKCAACDLWFGLEKVCSACGGPTEPYDGFTRLASTPPSGTNLHDAIASALYNFLTTEQIDGVPLLEASP
jgi:hypothetical protein